MKKILSIVLLSIMLLSCDNKYYAVQEEFPYAKDIKPIVDRNHEFIVIDDENVVWYVRVSEFGDIIRVKQKIWKFTN